MGRGLVATESWDVPSILEEAFERDIYKLKFAHGVNSRQKFMGVMTSARSKYTRNALSSSISGAVRYDYDIIECDVGPAGYLCHYPEVTSSDLRVEDVLGLFSRGLTNSELLVPMCQCQSMNLIGIKFDIKSKEFIHHVLKEILKINPRPLHFLLWLNADVFGPGAKFSVNEFLRTDVPFSYVLSLGYSDKPREISSAAIIDNGNKDISSASNERTRVELLRSYIPEMARCVVDILGLRTHVGHITFAIDVHLAFIARHELSSLLCLPFQGTGEPTSRIDCADEDDSRKYYPNQLPHCDRDISHYHGVSQFPLHPKMDHRITTLTLWSRSGTTIRQSELDCLFEVVPRSRVFLDVQIDNDLEAA